jgi:alpha-glucosidase (family GH31 glycosyl hydrolase)
MANPLKAIKAVKKTVTKTKQAIPTKIKTTNKTYNVKKTLTGKVKLKDTKSKKTVTIPKNQSLTNYNIRQAKARKIQKQMKIKENAKIYGSGTAIGAAIGIPLGNAIVKRRSK